MPLFEAIVNSIQAIEEESVTKQGIIEVDLIRKNQKGLILDGQEELPTIIDFIIKDKRAGFNEKKYESFNHTHSTYNKGGKDIGSFTWLNHSKERIESRIKQTGYWNIRKFSFEPAKLIL